ncbi:MAG: nicotinate-nicotinamide nucleotide adenylyltransferase [Myxococcota bacterium]
MIAPALLASLDATLPPLPPSRSVALFGGSFNPPHLAHSMLGLAVLSVEGACDLWVLPTSTHAFGKELVAFEHRADMCRLAFSRLGPRAHVVEAERLLPTPNYTVTMLRAFHEVRPEARFLWVAGADLLEELHLWREPEEVLRLAELFLVPRPGYDDQHRARLGFALPELSSSRLREDLAEGRDVSGLLDSDVLRLVSKRGLYQGAPAPSRS